MSIENSCDYCICNGSTTERCGRSGCSRTWSYRLGPFANGCRHYDCLVVWYAIFSLTGKNSSHNLLCFSLSEYDLAVCTPSFGVVLQSLQEKCYFFIPSLLLVCNSFLNKSLSYAGRTGHAGVPSLRRSMKNPENFERCISIAFFSIYVM